MEGWMERCLDEMDRWMAGWLDGLMDRWRDGWVDEWMNRQANGWMQAYIHE